MDNIGIKSNILYVYCARQFQFKTTYLWEIMKPSRTMRTFILACVGLLSLFVLIACDDHIYKETGLELSMTKTASPTTVTQAGQVITYTYIVTNNGQDPKNGSNGLSPMAIVLTDAPLDGPIVCPVALAAALNNSQSMTCTATYTVTDTDIASGSITNNAVVTGSYTSQDCLYSISKDYYSCVNTKTKHTATDKARAVVNVNLAAGQVTAVPAATEIPVSTPTATAPSITETPARPLPMLMGNVTYCDPAAHLMNLPFVNGFNPLDFNQVVTMNGQSVNCMVNTSNSKLLTCAYPSSLAFPVNIQVTFNAMVVNDFMFDGASCAAPVPATKTPSKQPNSGPTACPPGAVCP
jgi:hypothetical protein